MIWRQARADPDDEQVSWERYVAWPRRAGIQCPLELLAQAGVLGQQPLF